MIAQNNVSLYLQENNTIIAENNVKLDISVLKDIQSIVLCYSR